MAIRFGPASWGSVTEGEETLEKYHKLGLRASETPFTYAVYVKKEEDGRRIGKKARELGIVLSVHAPYFVNLNSLEKEKREASKKRILDSCRAGEWLGASVVVFHPGFYSKGGREKDFEMIKGEIKEMQEFIKKQEWRIKLAPETMGKVNVFGSIEEIARLVRETGCSFCLDFAHILAREKKIDWERINELFPQEKWHCHFSGIEYGEKGERHHRTTKKEEWTELLRNLPGDKDIVIINESPTLVADSVEGLKLSKEFY
jgi:deoxyribonuclease-4